MKPLKQYGLQSERVLGVGKQPGHRGPQRVQALAAVRGDRKSVV